MSFLLSMKFIVRLFHHHCQQRRSDYTTDRLHDKRGEDLKMRRREGAKGENNLKCKM